MPPGVRRTALSPPSAPPASSPSDTGAATITATYGALSDTTTVNVVTAAAVDSYLPIDYAYTGATYSDGAIATFCALPSARRRRSPTTSLASVGGQYLGISQSAAPVAYLAIAGGATVATKVSSVGAGAVTAEWGRVHLRHSCRSHYRRQLRLLGVGAFRRLRSTVRLLHCLPTSRRNLPCSNLPQPVLGSSASHRLPALTQHSRPIPLAAFPSISLSR